MTHAPIVQMLLTVQFQPAAQSLTIIEWADLRALFEADFPVFAQVSRAGPMNPDPRVEQLTFAIGGEGMPRLQLLSEDLAVVVYLQDDRVSVGWARRAPLDADPGYPGFDHLLGQLLSVLATVLKFIEERAVETVSLAAAEVVYDDAFLMHKGGARLRRLEDVFTCVRSMEEFAFNRLNLTYQRILLPEQDGLSGSVQTTIAGWNAPSPDEITSNLQTVIRFAIEGLDQEGLRVPFEKAHRLAHKLYDTLVKAEATAILDVS